MSEFDLVDDIFNLLCGIDGTLVKFDGSLVCTSLIDDSLACFARKFTPLLDSLHLLEASIKSFERYGAGLVRNALAASLKSIVNEFHLLVIQLESEQRSMPDFSLHRLWYHVQSSISSISICAELCSSLENSCSSSVSFDPLMANSFAFASLASLSDSADHCGVLSVLSQFYVLKSGDPAAKKLLSFLLSSATRPFLQILRTWIHKGRLDDVYDEFFIVENRSLVKDSLLEDFSDRYWDHRYSIRASAVPPFLAPFVSKILLTGKYLNAFIECEGESAISSTINCQPLMLDDLAKLVDGSGSCISEIDGAYKLANKLLLDHLCLKQRLVARLASLKRFFLFDQSDFIDDFLDVAKEELDKLHQTANVAKLQSLFEVTLSNPSSPSSRDAFKDDIRIILNEKDFFDTILSIVNAKRLEHASFHRAIVCLSLDYKATFPLSLVLGKRSISKYQLIFGLFLTLRRHERQLDAVWRHQIKNKRKYANASLALCASRLAMLRMRMASFLQALGYFLSFDVIEVHYFQMSAQLKNAQTVDQVLEAVHSFLGSCLKDATLTNTRLVSCLFALVRHINIFTSTYHDFARSSSTSVFLALSKTLGVLEEGWVRDLREYLNALRVMSESSKYMVLIARIDFAGYYMSK